MEKTVKKLSQVYYYIYSATILATIIGYIYRMNTDNHLDLNSPLGIALKSIVILYILISLPLALGGFFRMTKKWIAIEDETLKFKAYQKGATLRLLLVGIGLISSITVFYVTKDVSLIYCAGISAIVLLFFCKPTVAKMVNDLKLEE